MNTTFRIAVVGDVHSYLDRVDVRLLDEAGYDLVLFVGDLAGLRLRSTLKVAQLIGTFRTPVLVVPGNHDAPNAVQLLAEVLHNERLVRLADRGIERRADAIADALGPAGLAGYSLHDLTTELQLVAARPHSMGGNALSFAPFLARRFKVQSLDDSARLLCDLVDQSRAANLLFVGHNGPSGVGGSRSDLWGCDFRAEEGDFGDPDLEVAITYARSIGKSVVGVIAGHMHRRLRGGGERTERLQRNGTLYLNAAQVPRIWKDARGHTRRHHVAVRWDGVELEAEEILW